MRRFELILAFVAAFAVIWPAVFGVRPRRGVAAGLLTIAFILQLQIEGYRWQILPIYLVSLGLLALAYVTLEGRAWWLMALAMVPGAAVLLHQLYYLYSVLGYAYCRLEHVVR